MLPYFELRAIGFGPFRLPVFGPLLATAIFVARWRILRLERAEGRSTERTIAILCLVILVSGLLAAHALKVALADISSFLANPAIVTRRSQGMMSVGGFYGGLLVGLLWCRLRGLTGVEALRMLDRIAFVLPLSWTIGRLGCALIHDHIGRASASWLAVRFPAGPAWDLGVIEFLFLIPVVFLFWFLGRKQRPPGFFFGLFGVLYGGLRAWLETLQAYPPTWGPFAGLAGQATGLGGWAAMIYYNQRSRRVRHRTS